MVARLASGSSYSCLGIAAASGQYGASGCAVPCLVLLANVALFRMQYLDIIGTPIPAPRPSVGCAIRTNIDAGVYSK